MPRHPGAAAARSSLRTESDAPVLKKNLKRSFGVERIQDEEKVEMRILIISLHPFGLRCITASAWCELIALAEFVCFCLCTATVVAHCIDKTLAMSHDFCKTESFRGTDLIALSK